MLEHFVIAQEPVYDNVRAELRLGRKATHWMWFIFPQLAGLGHSDMSKRYELESLDAARDYLDHPVLGPRLIECTQQVNRIEGRTAHEIFGPPDDLKFRSSMTLFHRARQNEVAFSEALDKYYDGIEDPQTLGLLRE